MTLPSMPHLGPKILVIIPARGGSKGIPKKNLALLNGKPLLQYTIDAAKKASVSDMVAFGIPESEYTKPRIDTVIVSSDYKEILEYVSGYGYLDQNGDYKVIKYLVPELVKANIYHDGAYPYHGPTTYAMARPAEISTDASLCEDVVLHVLKNYKPQGYMRPVKASDVFEYIMLLQPTSPLRDASIITKCIEQLHTYKASSLITVKKMEDSPYKAIRFDEKGNLGPVMGIKEYLTKSRQELPECFIPNGAVYIVKTDLFLKTRSFFHKDTQLFIMDKERSLDIDTPKDLILAEEYLKSLHERAT